MSGTAAFYDGMLQMVHPDRVVPEAEADKLPLIEPVYPLTEGLGPNVVRKAVEGALGRAPVLPEWQDAAWLRQQEWPAFRDAITRPAPPGRSRRGRAGNAGVVAACL